MRISYAKEFNQNVSSTENITNICFVPPLISCMYIQTHSHIQGAFLCHGKKRMATEMRLVNIKKGGLPST